MSAWEQLGERPKELDDLKVLPSSCYAVWGWFMSLNESRSSSGFGLNPIAYSDISAYFQLKQVIPDEWEIDLLKRFDREVMKVYAEKAKLDSKKKN